MVKWNVRRLSGYNALPALITTFIIWLIGGLIVWFIPPHNDMVVYGLIVLVAGASFLTLTLITTRKAAGLVGAGGIVCFLLAGYFGFGTVLTMLLISGITIAAIGLVWSYQQNHH